MEGSGVCVGGLFEVDAGSSFLTNLAAPSEKLAAPSRTKSNIRARCAQHEKLATLAAPIIKNHGTLAAPSSNHPPPGKKPALPN